MRITSSAQSIADGEFEFSGIPWIIHRTVQNFEISISLTVKLKAQDAPTVHVRLQDHFLIPTRVRRSNSGIELDFASKAQLSISISVNVFAFKFLRDYHFIYLPVKAFEVCSLVFS